MTSARAAVRIRRAKPADRAAMLEITRNVWEGTDYLPFVWDEWLEDASGYLMVAERDGVVVGLQHVDLQTDGVAWVEGIRVSESERGAGIGHSMLLAAIEWGRSEGASCVRLSTSSGNAASGRIAEKAGFHLAGTFLALRADPMFDGNVTCARVARTEEHADIWRFVERAGSSVYTEGWTAYSLSPERLRLLLGTEAVAVVGDREIEAVAIATAFPERPSLRLGYLRGSEEGMVALSTWLRLRVADTGLQSVRATVESAEGVEEALRSAGFDSQHGNAMLLHELAL